MNYLNDTAQGNALGTLARSVDKIAVLTGTLMGGYADDLFNVLYRLEPQKMVAEGYEWGEAGIRNFAESYGVLERVTIIPPEENACSKAKVTKQVKRKPGASPLLFGKFLMELGAFVSLEDISSELPAYREEVSRPGESHPEALSEPCLNVSAHTAPAMEPRRTPICQCAHNFGSRLEIRATQCVALAQMPAQLLVFPIGPTGQRSIQLPHRRIERRPVKSPVILEPASE